MASTQLAYRESDDLKSGNSAPPPPSPLVRRINASRLPARLARTLASLIVVSKHGPDLWASTFAVRIEADICYRTAQRHIDELERRCVLQKKYEANVVIRNFGFRRTATYVLHPEANRWLRPRLTHQQWKNTRPAAEPIRPRSSHDSQHRSPSPARGAAPHTPPPTAAPAPVPFPSRKLTRDEKAALVRIYVGLRQPIAAPAAVESPPPPQPQAREAWSRILAHIKAQINPHTFETWLRPTSGSHEQDGLLCIFVPNDGFLDIGRRFEEPLTRALSGLQLPYDGIRFFAADPPEAPRPAMSAEDALAEACRQLRISAEDGIVALKIAGVSTTEGT